jgi:hypothetical protein
MNTGLKYSIALHITLVALSYVGIPHIYKPIIPEKVITIDIVKKANITNLQNTKIASTKNTQHISSQVTSKQNHLTSEAINNKKPAITPEKKEPQLDKSENAKKIETNPPKPVQTIEKPTKLNSKSSLDNLLKDLDRASLGNPNKIKKHAKQSDVLGSSNKKHNDALPLSISEKDNIKTQIEKKFVNPVVLDFNSGEIVIKLRIDMESNGVVKRVITLNDSLYPKKYIDIFSALKDSLTRATYMASPIQNLPEDKYYGHQGWKEIELTFDAYYLMNN